MKTILTLMAVVAWVGFALGDVGVTLPSGTSHESYTIGSDPVDKDPSYWYIDNGVPNNRVASLIGDRYDGERPDQFAGQVNAKILNVDCGMDSGVFYKMAPSSEAKGESVEIPTEGIFIDTVMKFDPMAETPVVSADDDKLVVWMKEGEPGEMNLMVTAGYYDQSGHISTKHYRVKETGFKPKTWYRVTVKAIREVRRPHPNPEERIMAFVIYVDQKMLTYEDDAFDPSSWIVDDLMAEVSLRYYGAARHALFPSRIAWDCVDGRRLTSVGYVGRGSVDDISFTERKPSFASSKKPVLVTWSHGVSSLTITPAGGTPVTLSDLSGGGSYPFEIDAGVEQLTVNATYADHSAGLKYISGRWGADAETTMVKTGSSSATFSALHENSVCCVEAILPVFSVGGEFFESPAEAIRAAAGMSRDSAKTIVLEQDAVIECGPDAAALNVPCEAYVRLDLNGHTLAGALNAEGEGDVTVNVAGHLWIDDSVGDGRVFGVEGVSDSPAVFAENPGVIEFERGTVEGSVLADFEGVSDRLADFMTISGGRFLASANDYDALSECVRDARYELVEKDGYFELKLRAETPEQEEIAEALATAGFSETARGAIATREAYEAFVAYCGSELGLGVKASDGGSLPAFADDSGSGSAQTRVKENALVSYALDAGRIERALKSGDVVIDEARSLADGAMELTVRIEGVVPGDEIRDDVLRRVLTVRGGTTPASMEEANVEVFGRCAEVGVIRVKARPKAGVAAESFFYQAVINK